MGSLRVAEWAVWYIYVNRRTMKSKSFVPRPQTQARREKRVTCSALEETAA